MNRQQLQEILARRIWWKTIYREIRRLSGGTLRIRRLLRVKTMKSSLKMKTLWVLTSLRLRLTSISTIPMRQSAKANINVAAVPSISKSTPTQNSVLRIRNPRFKLAMATISPSHRPTSNDVLVLPNSCSMSGITLITSTGPAWLQNRN